MWKDFFYFSKGERVAILALALLIVLVQISIWTVDYWQPLLPDKLTGLRARREALAAFQDSLSEKDGSGQQSSYASYTDRSKKNSTFQKGGVLTSFNPNNADSAKLVSLGIRPYVARNIQKYRQKGGVFRKNEDLARIYGLDPATYARLKPFIRLNAESGTSIAGPSDLSGLAGANSNIGLSEHVIARDGIAASDGIPSEPGQGGMNGKSAAPYSVLVMDINKVDTAMLQQLKGVGAASANRIVRYRNSLGGFYSTHQLEEIKGLYPETLSRIKSLLKVDTAQITKINANKASLERLKAHPYLSFYQAKVIVELRKARSGIKNINELAEFKEFSGADIDRLRWYLVF